MLSRSTPFFRLAILGLILLATVILGALHAEAAEAPRPPLSAIVVQECSHTAFVFFTMLDGTVEKVVPTVANTGAIIDLLKVTGRVVVLEMDCTRVGHDSIR
jgi:hypothetical protein